jgi:hypothetical protein
MRYTCSLYAMYLCLYSVARPFSMGHYSVRTCHVFYGLHILLYHEELPTDRKKATTIRLDKNLLQTAHDLGLNVSKVCENALIDMINRLIGSNIQITSRSRFGRGSNRFLARGEGFEPSRPFLTTDLAGLPPTRRTALSSFS